MIFPFMVIRKIQRGQKRYREQNKIEFEPKLCTNDKYGIAKIYKLFSKFKTGGTGKLFDKVD